MTLKTILIADFQDQDLVSLALDNTLTQVSVKQVSGIENCALMLQQDRPVLLIIDEKLGNVADILTGLQAAKRPASVIVLCDDETSTHWESQIPKNITEYFVKPIQLQKLNRYVQLLLTESESAHAMVELAATQHKLGKCEQTLMRTQQVGRLGSYVFDIETGKWTCSSVMREIFGIPLDYQNDLENWQELIYESDREAMLQYFLEQVLEQQQPFDKIYRIQRLNDGEVRWVHGLGSLELDGAGKPIRVFGTIQDITQRYLAEAELRKLLFALEQSPASIIITSIQGDIEYVNAKFVEITGYSLTEVLGQNPRILSSGEKSPADYAELWETVLSGGVWEGEFHNKRKDGELYWEWAVISPIRDQTGKITQLLAVKEDITQRKIDAEKQHSLQSQLNRAQRMEAIGTLAGGIAHDFNNILQSMYLYLGMAQDALPEGEIKDDIAQVSEAALRARNLVTQILTYSRQGEMERSKVLIQFVIKEALKFLKSSLPKSVKLQSYINQDCPPVYCDPTQIHQIFMNICTNAYDALPDQTGTIRVVLDSIELGAEQDPGLTLKHGKYLELIISDDGAGMPPGVKHQIFNPFFSTKEPGMGSGLGLSVAVGILEELDGQILVESEEGRGTEFKILLPVAAEQAVATTDLTLEASELEQLSILVIDDDDAIRQGIHRTLEKFGCHVVSCQRPDDLLDLLDEHQPPFSTILAEQDLPGMSGLKLAYLVKQKHPKVAFILMTGAERSQHSSGPESDFVDAVLAKPWQTVDLLSTIVSAIQSMAEEPSLKQNENED